MIRGDSNLHTDEFLFQSSHFLQTVVSYLHAWGIAGGDIILEPLLRPHSHHYTAIHFQLHLLEQPEAGVTSLAAIGQQNVTQGTPLPWTLPVL